jgi:REP-associated tyrosine transposase
MPRIARAVFANVPHHVTQRGNRRGTVFFSNDDRSEYLRLLREYADRHAVDVLAYCLMPNHVHIVVVPATKSALHQVLRPLHMRHAQRINRARGWTGHLWQGRYFASALDENYVWTAIRYVERNPVRAGLARRAEEYRWSSAAAHCGPRADPVLTTDPNWQQRLKIISNWSAWLACPDEDRHLEMLRSKADKGLPCGSNEFVENLEHASGRHLKGRPQGRQASENT